MDESDRTSAVGFFNTARSYWRSAEHLRTARVKVTHPDAPVTFLFCHAVELYLKGYMRGRGRELGELKRLGHRVADLSKTALEAGLKLSSDHCELLSHIDEAEVAIEARYIVTGFKNRPTNEAFSEICEALDKSVCAALSEIGLPVRAEEFIVPVTGPSEIGVDADRVLVHLFTTSNQSMRDVGAMARQLGFEEGFLKYHLDSLEEAGLAECTGFNTLSEEVYWAITKEGRKYAVLHKLV
jgi:hypothetical protein